MLKFLKTYIPFTWISLLIITLSVTLAYRLEGNGVQSIIEDNLELRVEIRGLEARIENLLKTEVSIFPSVLDKD